MSTILFLFQIVNYGISGHFVFHNDSFEYGTREYLEEKHGVKDRDVSCTDSCVGVKLRGFSVGTAIVN
jgi:hypothetical protein